MPIAEGRCADAFLCAIDFRACVLVPTLKEKNKTKQNKDVAGGQRTGKRSY